MPEARCVFEASDNTKRFSEHLDDDPSEVIPSPVPLWAAGGGRAVVTQRFDLLTVRPGSN